ncbi:MAG: hypothetical protein NZ930_05125 [Candidatus Bipolaricaulota bacterium]|nr:hypothetical protein [Candidatus Bipolaricaulota bacterium]MDW8030408.1 hypothetical protein [Candidatus Bipolaricaulota bacterium]
MSGVFLLHCVGVLLGIVGCSLGGLGADEAQATSLIGYLIAAVNYLLAPRYKFPATIEDVKCA